MSRRVRQLLRDERGVTLIEMMAVLAILGIVVGAFVAVYTATIRHSSEVQEQNTLQTEARAVVDTLAQEVRQAWTHEDDTTYPTPVITATGTQVTFLSPDRANPYHLRTISYRVNSGRLERALAVSSDTDGPPWVMPALGSWASRVGSVVANPGGTAVFQYLKADGTTTTSAALARSVVITLSLATKTSPSRTVTFSTRATLRAENT
jgi:prepilin-type N-terminal cleavage/methylation domain-containing protein